MIQITDFSAPEPDVYARLTEAQLLNKDHPEEVYIDFDVVHEMDVAVYPDSHKIGIWGRGVDRLYAMDNHVGYYDGE